MTPAARHDLRNRLQALYCWRDEITKASCKHCEAPIKHFDGMLWHANGEVIFPQYCKTKYDQQNNILPAQLHEPASTGSDKERALIGALIGEYESRLALPKPAIPEGYSPHVHVSEVQS